MKFVEEDGSITITLAEDQRMENGQPVITYSIDTNADNAGTVEVVDDDKLPVISIVANSGEIAENAGPAKFMLTATGLTTSDILMINATPAEDGSDYLMDAIADTAEIFPVAFTDFDGDSIYTGEIEVILDNDTTGEATGDIKLTLNADPKLADTYQLGENREGFITILDDDAPELQISAVSESVEEKNPTENVTANFNISAKVSPNRSITIYYNLAVFGDVIDNNTISTGTGKSAEFDFSRGNTEVTLSIPIVSDNLDEANGTITVTLVEDDASPITYTVPSSPKDTAEVEVIDDDGLPQIKISTSTPSIKEGEQAEFVLTATPEGSITPQQPKMVEFKVEQEGDFLLWRVARSFIMESTLETFTINTRDNNTVDKEGSVTLSLVDSPTNYVISENSDLYSAQVTITDNDDDPNDPQATEPEARISVAEVAVNTILNDVLAQVNNNPTAVESETPSPINPNIPTVSVDASHSQVDEGNPVEFTISASGGSDTSATLVRLNLNPVGDFFDFSESKQISRRIQGNQSVQVVFPTIDDTLAEADGRLEVCYHPRFFISR